MDEINDFIKEKWKIDENELVVIDITAKSTAVTKDQIFMSCKLVEKGKLLTRIVIGAKVLNDINWKAGDRVKLKRSTKRNLITIERAGNENSLVIRKTGNNFLIQSLHILLEEREHKEAKIEMKSHNGIVMTY